ncbi:MAG: hypothetical protein OK456_09735 [Thaumarchaeota archaeon]|nr:hypothetical protein [Nitrososphaerota archaeon]
MLILLGDIFGYLALLLVIFTASFMLVRRRLLKYTKNLNLLRKVHIYAATAAGFFIVLHVAYFFSYPITDAILLGYLSAAMAVFVWVTGTAFLERLRDSLFFHGTMSLSTVGLMVVHSAGAGVNIPVWLAAVTLVVVASISVVKAWDHLSKVVVSLEVKKH